MLKPLAVALTLVEPDAGSFSFTGRWDLSDPKLPKFQWPLTAIQTKVSCSEPTTLTFALSTSDHYSVFNVYNNGQLTQVNYMQPGAHNLTVQVEGEVAVVVEKGTEDFSPDPTMQLFPRIFDSPPVSFSGMSMSSPCHISKPSAKTRRIEVIGDSISCGFGNALQRDNKKESAFCAGGVAIGTIFDKQPEIIYNLTSSRQAYSAQLAQSFGADLHLQCISGIGVCKNGDDFGPTSPRNITNFIDKALPYQKNSTWDYSLWHPDLVVMNLGTNDYDLFRSPAAGEFESEYFRLASKHMGHYPPSTPLILACGPMTIKQCSSVEKVAQALTGSGVKATFVNVSLAGTPSGLHGCIFHPDIAEDTQMARAIAPVISSVTGWHQL
eukprot:CAMPEP_0175150786 /NCGR_PEP_ID=MMETSP0087-20121206/18090_1 /TAXON_ID=136419 /ORGANISM="Unknown Unknown, Strain D1" /LENGTH=380 /DNA_ID=CAMNT_0016436823 /DNA_START=83 /DNA_END=1225 /DNA_ORIENTATION=+